jgi:hypothetical protein
MRVAILTIKLTILQLVKMHKKIHPKKISTPKKTSSHHSRSNFGYSATGPVTDVNALQQKDTQESFFAAETLKYLYLINMPRSFFSLEDYVLSTEAHPFPRLKEKQDIQLFEQLVQGKNKEGSGGKNL